MTANSRERRLRATGVGRHCASAAPIGHFWAAPQLRYLLMATTAILLSACASDPKDVAIFGDSPMYYASVLVGARPGKCLVVVIDVRSFIPCKDVTAFIKHKVHPPANAPILVVPRKDQDIPAWKALRAELVSAGYNPDA